VFWMLAPREKPLAGQSSSGWSVLNNRRGLTRDGLFG